MGGGFDLRWKRRIIIFLVLVLRVNGWGKEGHYAICKIAEYFFTEDALAAVKSLLPERAEGDLASVCSWADEVRHDPHYRWSSHLHYVNTPDFACNYEYARDCHKDRCVTGAIYNYTMQLMSGHNNDSDLTARKYNLTEALMFLSHFVGDVHQPLHVGFKGDEGGNTIIVRWYRRKTNLHHVWDDMIIESAIKKFYNSELSTMIQSIHINIMDGYFDDESSWQNCNEMVCPDTYASESINTACKFAYRNATPGSTLEESGKRKNHAEVTRHQNAHDQWGCVGIINPIPNMETLTCKKSFFELVPHVFPSVFFSPLSNKNRIFLRINHRKHLNSFNTLRVSSTAYHHSLTYSGWDDLLQNGGSTIHSGESILLDNVLNSLGISGRKYVFVYLFGFVCALAISRVKVSTIAVFPACALVFAIGFSVGLVKAGQLKESKLDGNRRKLMEETYNCFIEKLRNLVDNLNGYNVKIVNLKNDIRKRIECNQVTVSVLEGYLDVIECDTAFVNAVDVVESCIQSILRGDKIKEVNSCPELSTRKKFGENGFIFSQIFVGLFGGNPVGSKTDKLEELGYGEVVDGKVNNRKEANILSASIKERNLNSLMNGKLEDKTARIVSNPFDETVRSQNNDEDYVVGSGVRNEVFEYQKKKLPDKNGTTKSVFNQTDYSYCSKKSRLVKDEQVYLKDYDQEAMSRCHNSYNSEDFIISGKRIETASSFGHRQKLETRDMNYWQSESADKGRTEFWSSFKGDTSRPQKQPSFTSEEPAHRNALGSAPSSIADDLEFGRYLSEANNLFKEAKGCFRHQVDHDRSENALYKSAVLLSKAIEIRPMSLLAVEKLGNTYLLHGELKLWISRKLRSQLARKYPFSIEEGMKVPKRFDYPLADKEKIKLTLVDVCEECEELLIMAGRKYKWALSIDGNAMRALYNWGLALSFRAQLIADIGQIAARDADQVFMAATDKFEALMSRSNDHAPDALLKWGAALQDRSRLRPGRSREKVKLLQQARCLYEDALHMDSGNLQLQKALSSCVSELDHWYS